MTKHKSTADLRKLGHPGQMKGLSGITELKGAQSDVVTFQQQVDNIYGPGPAAYNLPSLITSKGNINNSTMRTQPRVSIGLKPKKASYYHECYKDFIGGDAPNVASYSPNTKSVLKKEPQFSVGRFQRFHKASSVVKLDKNV